MIFGHIPIPGLFVRAAWLLCGFLLFPMAALSQVDVAIHVTDQDAGSALEQVRVEIVLFPDTIAHMGFTDGTGRIEFRNVLKRKYVLRATKESYLLYQDSLDLSTQASNAIIAVRMRRTPSQPEPPGGVVSARVLAIPEAARKEFKAGLDVFEGNPKESMKHFQKAILGFPSYYEAYYMLGMAQLKTGDGAGGDASLRKAVELQPKYLDPYYPLSELLIRDRRYEEAEKLLMTAYLQDQESWKWPYELAFCYGKMNLWDKGLEFGLIAQGRKEAPTKVRLLLADLYSNRGDTAKAIAELETFKKEDPNSPMIPRVNEVLKQLRR